MASFGGWDMPIQYPEGILKSHLHTRQNAGLFDVSHMLGVAVRGADRVAFMEKLCTADLQSLPEGMGGLTVLTNEGGGIIDDCIVTNAGNKRSNALSFSAAFTKHCAAFTKHCATFPAAFPAAFFLAFPAAVLATVPAAFYAAFSAAFPEVASTTCRQRGPAT